MTQQHVELLTMHAVVAVLVIAAVRALAALRDCFRGPPHQRVRGASTSDPLAQARPSWSDTSSLQEHP